LGRGKNTTKKVRRAGGGGRHEVSLQKRGDNEKGNSSLRDH